MTWNLATKVIFFMVMFDPTPMVSRKPPRFRGSEASHPKHVCEMLTSKSWLQLPPNHMSPKSCKSCCWLTCGIICLRSRLHHLRWVLRCSTLVFAGTALFQSCCSTIIFEFSPLLLKYKYRTHLSYVPLSAPH